MLIVLQLLPGVVSVLESQALDFQLALHLHPYGIPKNGRDVRWEFSAWEISERELQPL